MMMEFAVKRTSVWSDEAPLCEGLYKKKIDVIEVRTLKAEQEFDERFSHHEGTWRSKGVDHCHTEEDGYIQRRHPLSEDRWFIKFETLEDLMEFKSTHGDLVLTNDCSNYKIPVVEIYDGYRE